MESSGVEDNADIGDTVASLQRLSTVVDRAAAAAPSGGIIERQQSVLEEDNLQCAVCLVGAAPRTGTCPFAGTQRRSLSWLLLNLVCTW